MFKEDKRYRRRNFAHYLLLACAIVYSLLSPGGRQQHTVAQCGIWWGTYVTTTTREMRLLRKEVVEKRQAQKSSTVMLSQGLQQICAHSSGYWYMYLSMISPKQFALTDLTLLSLSLSLWLSLFLSKQKLQTDMDATVLWVRRKPLFTP